ncbi:hypothetical protein BABINDRAFT_38305 [Babjeviella inositovora NRRL Y-12698]|uniref:C2H2-type domain-containing protein n=1 Tax=Babjeviella inositovora NRRL Y-12698 TaxID=984486 RepID=A0A1E3QQM7_9ASCO|nr:uncharacterized protein BABINDRAFT_38305 [Babjeviella inositovora NRRL Y-12698]ODQ79267.1 hypothetical protein BABINDRAFT_38305 [Babjeviella inositovora NRRL Y-12698]
MLNGPVSDQTLDPDYQFSFNFNSEPVEVQQKCHWNNCYTNFASDSALRSHIVNDHINEEYYRSPLPQSPRYLTSYQCEWDTCNYNSNDRESLLAHINTHGGSSSLNLHGAPHIDLTESILTPASPFELSKPADQEILSPEAIGAAHTCMWRSGGLACHQMFALAGGLTNHIISAHVGSGVSSYTCHWDGCSRCERPFSQRQKILRHIHVHTKYKPFQCPQCSTSFTMGCMLEQHMRTHSGEKPYKCLQCAKRFATSTALSIHFRTHTGEKPLECKFPNCGKKFSESSNLAKHMKTHSKCFRCELCEGVEFKKKTDWNRHMKKVHLESSPDEEERKKSKLS